MTTIGENLAAAISRLVPPSAAKTILGTLGVTANRKIGSLDVAATRDLMSQLAIGLKLFAGQPVAPRSLALMREHITGGQPCAPTRKVLKVASEEDARQVQRKCQAMAKGFFNSADGVQLAATAYELARNIHQHARRGSVTLTLSETSHRVTFTLLAEDLGPGIPDVKSVLTDEAGATGNKGLRAAQASLDGFEIESKPGEGTRVRGWKRAMLT